MIDDQSLLEDWYRYAASSRGFIGFALYTERTKSFITQEQQRALLGILGEKYDRIWLRLRSMPLPRSGQHFKSDLERVVECVVTEVGVEASLDVEKLGELIQVGLEG